ncbi:MAG: tRNA (mnm(5)s(2)U34)-methyltransferase [Oscillospiraceae bacterium]
MEHIVSFSHTLLNQHLSTTDISIDFTLGNGNDAAFLSQLCIDGFVYGFDTQKIAIENSRNLMLQKNINNVKLILDSHSNLDKYIDKEIGGGIFNLGYLPNGDKSITTNFETTKIAILKSLDILKKSGIIVIVCYTGHYGGLDEALSLENFCINLNSKHFNVISYKLINKKLCPFILAIYKV